MPVAEELIARARASGLFVFVTKTLKFTRPEVRVSIDRAKSARLGVSMQSIGDTLSIMLGESEVNRFSIEGRSYKVIPQAASDFRLTKTELGKYYVRTTAGILVPLSTLVTLTQNVEPSALTQYQQLHSTNIEGMMMPPHFSRRWSRFSPEDTRGDRPLRISRRLRRGVAQIYGREIQLPRCSSGIPC